MSSNTTIEWTNAVWNPTRGCSIVSPGCSRCYAMKQAHRFSHKTGPYAGLTKMSKGGPVWTGEVRTVPELLDWPLRKKKPLRIFVNSMSDLFHEGVSDRFINGVFDVMALAHWHTFQILTKRPQRMRDYLLAPRRGLAVAPWPNIWLGVSVEDQARADERIPLLLQTPAAVHWISAEPLLGHVDLRVYMPNRLWNDLPSWKQPELDWVVVGGESGPGARPFNIKWAQSLIAQCRAAGVPVFMKQIGSLPISKQHGVGIGTFDVAWPHQDRKGGDPAEWPEDLRVREYPA